MTTHRTGIVLSADKNMLPLAAFVASQIRNTLAPQYNAEIVTLTDIADADTALGDSFAEIGIELIVSPLNRTVKKHVAREPRKSYATLWRLVAPQLLAERFDRILYIDCDTFVVGDLGPLLSLDLQGSPLAAAHDFINSIYENRNSTRKSTEIRVYKRGLGLGENDGYFNAGVLLIDVNEWLTQDLGGRAFQYLEAEPEKCIYSDQSALNHLTRGTWLPISTRYNFQRSLMEIENRIKIDPVIYHFCGGRKPWANDWDLAPHFHWAYKEFFAQHRSFIDPTKAGLNNKQKVKRIERRIRRRVYGATDLLGLTDRKQRDATKAEIFSDYFADFQLSLD